MNGAPPTELAYQASTSAVYYRPERAAAWARLVPALLAAAALAIGVAYLYVAGEARVDHILLRIGVCVAAAGATGAVCAGVVRLSRVATPALAAIIACAVSLPMLYASWLFWVRNWLEHVGWSVLFPELAREPVALFELIRMIQDHGAWSYKGQTVRGGSLLMVWIVEAAILVGGPVTLAVAAVGSLRPRCRACHGACEPVPGLPHLAGDNPDGVAAAVESRRFDLLPGFGPLRNDDDPQIDFRLLSCQSCGQTHVLTVSETAWFVDGQGQARVRTRPLVRDMLLTPAEAEAMVALRTRIEEMWPDAGEPDEPADTDGDDDDDSDDADSTRAGDSARASGPN